MTTRSRSPIGLTPQFPLIGMFAVIAALYLAREFIIPIVLAALVAFSLSPVVRWMERRRIPRLMAVLSVCCAVMLVLVSLAWTVVSQVADFAGELPKYRTNLLTKVEQLKMPSKGPWSGAAMTIGEVADRLEETAHKMVPSSNKKGVQLPVQVVVANENSAMKEMGLGIMSVAGPFGTAAVVGVLTIFMLLARDNVRDRMVHLAGRGRLGVTHQAMAESGRRVSRYLLAQTVVNIIYGCMVGGALAVIGVPNATLWGLVGVVVRYVPYLGPVIGFVLPFGVSLAVAPTWAIPLWVAGAFIIIEIIVNNVLEPHFYSSSTGLSPLAIIVSALFWAWMWGPMGLVLATPLTVCASVVGKQIPALGFLHILLSDDPPFTPTERFYQRLVANNSEEAVKEIENVRDDVTLTEALDEFALPAITGVQTAVNEGDLDLETEERMFRSLRQILPKIEKVYLDDDAMADTTTPEGAAPRTLRVSLVPVANEADAVVAEFLQSALRERQVDTELIQLGLLRSEKSDMVRAGKAGIALLVATTEDSARAARVLGRDISNDRPDIRVQALLSLPELEKRDKWKDQLSRSGVSDISASFGAAVKGVQTWLSMMPQPPSKEEVTVITQVLEAAPAA